jgi:NAD(P)-dependent dehydrogenase (short-subunit alcohol dehydrogenase family)
MGNLIFKDRVAIVTGAGRGLGRAIALRLAADGATVVVNDVDAAAAQETVALIGDGHRALVSTEDVGDHQGAQSMVAKTLTAFGAVHILVNNAGILRDALLAKMTEGDFDAVIRVNLKGVFNCTQAVVPPFRAQGGRSAIVNLASISYLGNVGQTNYAAAKAGVVGMTRTWALELARYGVRVNGVAPGLMDTDMVRGMPPEIRERMTQAIPLGRLGRPEEVAATVAFLASNEASYMTGQVLHLCGGSSVGGF